MLPAIWMAGDRQFTWSNKIQERGYSESPARPGRAAGRARYATSTIGRTGDALAPGGEEGRGRLRKAAGRRERPLIRGCPNGVTRPAGGRSTLRGCQPDELKHLSSRRRGKQQ